jgi:hypothetical protein
MTQSHYPSLCLLLNIHEAVWYRVEENRVEALASYAVEKDSYEDHEGGFGRGGGEPDVVTSLRDEEERHNLREIAEKTAELWRAGGFVHLTCVLHERFKNHFLEEIKKALPNVEPKLLFGNKTKADKKEILALFKDSLKVV